MAKAEEKITDMKAVEERIAQMLKEAEEKAKKIAEGKLSADACLTDEEKAEIARNEEYVEVKLFRDNDKYKDDVYVAVGDQNCVIKRGIPVKVKRKFYLALAETDDQDFKTAQLIERESGKYKEI